MCRGAADRRATKHPDKQEWLPLFNGRSLDGWTVKFAKHDLGENFNDTVRVENRSARSALRQMADVQQRVRPHLLSGAVCVLSPRRGVPVRRPAGDGRSGLGDQKQRSDASLSEAEHDAEGSRTCRSPSRSSFSAGLATGKPRTTANLCTPGSNVVMNGQLHTPHCTNSSVHDRGPTTAINGCAWKWKCTVTKWCGISSRAARSSSKAKPQIGGGYVAPVNTAMKIDGTPMTSGYIAIQAESVTDRLPQDRAAESRELQGSEGLQLQDVLRQRQPANVQGLKETLCPDSD